MIAGMGARRAFVFLAVICLAGRAVADGAFPDELSVMLPQNDANRILIGTNFGLVVSQDAGASWRYACEPYITGDVFDNVTLYSAASDGKVLATSLFAFWRSEDAGCTWTRAGGSVADVLARDAFFDPNDPSFVLAIATAKDSNTDAIHRSVDGGLTFASVYQTSHRLSGVEIARADSKVVYATELLDTSIAAAQAFLVKSVDRGVTWSVAQPLPDLHPGTEVRIAAVDPVDPGSVYLRLIDVVAGTDSIALTADGGQTLTVPPLVSVSAPVEFSTFLTAADGTLFAGTKNGVLYSAPPDSTSFSQRSGPRARCLGQRPGDVAAPIYACGDGFVDGYNLGRSDDGAKTFKPVMKFTDIAGSLLNCPAVTQACAASFAALQRTLGVGTPAPAPAPSPALGPKSGCASAGGGGAALFGLLVALGLRRKRR